MIGSLWSLPGWNASNQSGLFALKFGSVPLKQMVVPKLGPRAQLLPLFFLIWFEPLTKIELQMGAQGRVVPDQTRLHLRFERLSRSGPPESGGAELKAQERPNHRVLVVCHLKQLTPTFPGRVGNYLWTQPVRKLYRTDVEVILQWGKLRLLILA